MKVLNRAICLVGTWKLPVRVWPKVYMALLGHFSLLFKKKDYLNSLAINYFFFLKKKKKTPNIFVGVPLKNQLIVIIGDYI